MPHPLFGFRQRRGKIVIEPTEAAIVRAVLAAKPGTPVAIARLTPLDSYKAMACRVCRIRKHRYAYKVGRAVLGTPPNPRLVLAVSHGR